MHFSCFLAVADKLFQRGMIKEKKQNIALEIINRRIPLRFDLRSMVNVPEVSKVRDFIVDFEIPDNNFLANIATGKMFNPLCFFCKGTPTYVYIYRKPG